MTKEERIEKAVSLFKEGYNCSQSVVAAFADMYGFTEEQALKMASAFGGGIGRMRETCGAACGLFMLAGLEKGATKGSGSLRCSDLLGLSKKEPIVSTPEARTSAYYAKRPCAKMVETAARIWADYIYREE